MKALCWPTEVCYRVKNLKATVVNLDNQIDELYQTLEVKNTQLNDAIRHISSLIICPENGSDALRIQRAALDFIYKLE